MSSPWERVLFLWAFCLGKELSLSSIEIIKPIQRLLNWNVDPTSNFVSFLRLLTFCLNCRLTFNLCKSLQNVVIEGKINTISDYLFRDCYNLKTITIPFGVKTIGNYSFINCDALESVIIGSSVEKIENDATTEEVDFPEPKEEAEEK